MQNNPDRELDPTPKRTLARDLDGTLDSALASYSGPPPRDGLERRILAAIDHATPARTLLSPAWRLWLAFAPLAIFIVVLAFHPLPRRPSSIHTLSTASRATVSQNPPEAHLRQTDAATGVHVQFPALHPGLRSANSSGRSHRASTVSLPSRAHSLTPPALTSQDRALLALIRDHPQEAQRLLVADAADSPAPPEPIRIPALEIPSLD